MQSSIKFQRKVQEIQMKRAKRFIHTYLHTYIHTYQPSHRISISWLKTSIKEEITAQLTIAIKEAAIDCNIFSAKNTKEGLDCLSFGEPNNTTFAYNPDIEKDEDDTISSVNKEKITWQAEPVTIYGVKYAARKIKDRVYNVYDLQSYVKAAEGKGDPILVGKLEVLPGGKKVFNTLVT